jgi:hypothetical protein
MLRRVKNKTALTGARGTETLLIKSTWYFLYIINIFNEEETSINKLMKYLASKSFPTLIALEGWTRVVSCM